MNAVQTKSGLTAPTMPELVENIRIAVFDQENLIGLAMHQIFDSPERTESLLKAVERINGDMYHLYQSMEALVATEGGAA